jgi:hypothetical protein
MSDNEIKLAEKATLFLGGTGNVAVEVPAGTVVTVPGTNSRDELAEALATNTKVYAENRDQLAHVVERPHVFAEGETPRPARVPVTYGLHGARVEGDPAEAQAEDTAAEVVAERAEEPTPADNEAAG